MWTKVTVCPYGHFAGKPWFICGVFYAWRKSFEQVFAKLSRTGMWRGGRMEKICRAISLSG